jgi:hypothetical protein
MLRLHLKTVCLVLAFARTAAIAAEPDTTRYFKVLGELHRLSRESHESSISLPAGPLRDRVDALIPTSLPSELLFRIGVGAWMGFSGDAGNVGPDAVCYYASHRCALLLSERDDNRTPTYLELMQRICGRDGGEKLQYEELIKYQKDHAHAR